MADDIQPDPAGDDAEFSELEEGRARSDSDIAAALDAARPNQTLVTLAAGQKALLVRRRDTLVDELDLEKHQPRPVRPRGRTITVTSAAGFIAAVKDRAESDPANHVVVYADEGEQHLVGVVNDDGPDGAGWRDHRVVLKLDQTTEWAWWNERQGPHEQEFFARTIQVGEDEIVDPSPATMLEMAQTFHASMSATVKSGKRLRDGRTQVIYDEDQNASAGEGGSLEIPETFALSMRPFYGADLFKVTARIEWTLTQGKLKIGYHLVRPEDVERHAFLKMVETIEAELPDAPLIHGNP